MRVLRTLALPRHRRRASFPCLATFGGGRLLIVIDENFAIPIEVLGCGAGLGDKDLLA